MSYLLFSGTSNLPLAKKLARVLKIKLGKIEIKKFSDGETYVNILEKVRGRKILVLQSGNNPANENLMELLIIIDAIKRLGPKKITAILPFYPYRRQERKVGKGEPITAKLVAELLETAGVDKIVLIDIHSPKILKFFKVPVKELSAFPLFAEYFEKIISPSPSCLSPTLGRGKPWLFSLSSCGRGWPKVGRGATDFAILAPDKGSLEKSQKLAQALNLPFIKFYKIRPKHEQVEIKKESGKIVDKNVIIIDDEINTAGTIVAAVANLKKQGAKNIYLAATHAVLSGPAILRLKRTPIKEIILTDTIDIPKEKRLKKMRILSVAKLLKFFLSDFGEELKVR